MTENQRPILYSFRRCPFAMRARMAVIASAQHCELREVILRDKPAEMLEASPKATVPVLVECDGNVRDESLEIIDWALTANDPENWLTPELGDRATMMDLIALMDGDFKGHLDRYKYGVTRYRDENNGNGADPIAHRDAAIAILAAEFEPRLHTSRYLLGNRLSLADIATAPFVRQFCNTDTEWFAAQPYPKLKAWLQDFLDSDLFQSVMQKFPQWKSGTTGVAFPT